MQLAHFQSEQHEHKPLFRQFDNVTPQDLNLTKRVTGKLKQRVKQLESFMELTNKKRRKKKTKKDTTANRKYADTREEKRK